MVINSIHTDTETNLSINIDHKTEKAGGRRPFLSLF